MTNYLTIRETAEKWGISRRRVQMLCAQGAIEGAFKFGKNWAVPEDAKKPDDHRSLRFRTYSEHGSGYSLVEMTVVIAVMAVLVGILSPSLIRCVEKSRMRKDSYTMDCYTEAAKEILSDEKVFDEFRNFSEASGTDTVRIVFSPDGNTITAENGNVNSAGAIKDVMPRFSRELIKTVSENTQLVSDTYSDCGYIVEVKIGENSAEIRGGWDTSGKEN